MRTEDSTERVKDALDMIKRGFQQEEKFNHPRGPQRQKPTNIYRGTLQSRGKAIATGLSGTSSPHLEEKDSLANTSQIYDG